MYVFTNTFCQMINHNDNFFKEVTDKSKWKRTKSVTEWETLFIPVLSIFLLYCASKLSAYVKAKATIMRSEVLTVMKI